MSPSICCCCGTAMTAQDLTNPNVCLDCGQSSYETGTTTVADPVAVAEIAHTLFPAPYLPSVHLPSKAA